MNLQNGRIWNWKLTLLSWSRYFGPRIDSQQVSALLKIPVGNDKFFNEIHPNWGRLETVINGVFIGGSCQGPKNISESVQSSLSAAVKDQCTHQEPDYFSWNLSSHGSILMPASGVASVLKYANMMRSIRWKCTVKTVASVNEAVCKGCDMCAPDMFVGCNDMAQYPKTTRSKGWSMDSWKKLNLKPKQCCSQGADEEGIAMKDMPQIWRQLRLP